MRVSAVLAALFLSSAAMAQTPNIAPASPAQTGFPTEPSNEYQGMFQGKVDKDRGFSTNQTAALPVSNSYIATGAILLTDHKALLNCAVATCAMTLAAGTIDGYPLIIKRAPASAAVTVAANVDGTVQTISLGATGSTGVLRLRWDALLSTWDSE